MWNLAVGGRMLLVATLAAAIGCSPIRHQKESSPLSPARMSADSVILDVYFVRCPFGDPVVNEQLWPEVDEQQIPIETRRRLAQNGFRAGVVGGQIPLALSQLLQLKDQPAESTATLTTNVADVGDQQGPMWSHKQLRAGKRSEIVTSEIYDQLAVLKREDGGVCGRTYEKAQGVVAIRALPAGDGRVRLELLPELHHGEVRRSFSGSGGAWRVDLARPKCSLDEMAILADLAAGQMVLLTSLPNRPGSLGHHFLTTESSGKLEQKLLIIRLSQTQHDGLFEPSTLPLDKML
ncbi:MAG: hypothetical protein PHO07_05905 [Pirellulales bacterium]|jgi:hypothetical protein|nr:hypothetical protein [Thermoguttaceae bacterium]MDD4786692.1 hypothetical protein [Pirellulales bacterium]MDI9445212.1 hypothetical protein [Planctomycetota bacterium]NLY99588.1 hypothetical protein [Pirellulaceae bacterium]